MSVVRMKIEKIGSSDSVTYILVHFFVWNDFLYPCTHDGAPYAQRTGFLINIVIIIKVKLILNVDVKLGVDIKTQSLVP